MEEETKNRWMNYSLAYSSKQYEEREYTMTVRVYTEITFFREEIAMSNVKFRITKQLNGDIVIRQKEAKGHIVSSMENVEFEINLHDPSGKNSYNTEVISCLRLRTMSQLALFLSQIKAYMSHWAMFWQSYFSASVTEP